MSDSLVVLFGSLLLWNMRYIQVCSHVQILSKYDFDLVSNTVIILL